MTNEHHPEDSFTASELLNLIENGPFMSVREYLMKYAPQDIALVYTLQDALESAPARDLQVNLEPMQPARWDLMNLAMTLDALREVAS